MSAIVVGYDGTDGAKAALTEAAQLARELEAGIVAVFAHATSRLGGEVRDCDDAIRTVGPGHLEAARVTLCEAGLEPELELLALPPAEGAPGRRRAPRRAQDRRGLLRRAAVEERAGRLDADPPAAPLRAPGARRARPE